MEQPTDFLLLQFGVDPAAVPELGPAVARLCADSRVPLQLHRLAGTPSGEFYLYLRAPAGSRLPAQALPPLAALLQRHVAAARDVRVSRLQLVFEAPGHSSAQVPSRHYVVETDPEEGWMDEIARWYDTEHMPGLAAVPGCILALRCLNHDHGPVSLACYDLVSDEVLGSPPWLAVRHTAWSNIARPHFTNTKRTMFRALG